MKGQWFLISAVVASTVFFSISLMLEGYFASDSSEQASINKDFYFYNILEQVNNIVATTPTNISCVNLTTNLNEFKTVTERTLASKGYFSYLEYTITPPCGAVNIVKIDLIIATSKGQMYNFSTYTDPKQIVNQSK
jgi:5'(3')-deoxyribonucleotidase